MFLRLGLTLGEIWTDRGVLGESGPECRDTPGNPQRNLT